MLPLLPLLLAAGGAQAAVPNWQEWAWMDYNSSEPCRVDDAHHCNGNGNWPVTPCWALSPTPPWRWG